MKSRQLSFSGGEISPALYGRVDQTKYETGLKICRNFIVMRHGGLSNRAGSSIVAEVKDSTKNTRLIPFIFNPTQTYVLEVGDRYMRLIRNGGQITLPAVNIINISKSNPVYIYAVGHNCNNGDEIYIEGIQGMTELNGRNFIVSNRTPTTLSLLYKDVNYGQPVNASNFNEYTGLGTVNKIYETETPYLEEDIDDLIYIQSADVMTIVHPKYKVRELTRTGHTNWALNVVGFGPSIASPTSVVVTKGGAGTNTYKYKVTAIDIATLEESLPSSAAETTSAAAPTTSAPHVLTWAAVTNVLQYEIYKEQDDFYGWIGTAGSTGFDDTGYSIDASDNPPNDRQPFEANDDYPSAATYIQQRLLLAGSNNSPYTCYGSKSGLLKNFMISSPLQDDDAITFPILGGQVNTIKHLLDIGKLLVFTSGGEFFVQGDNAGILTPTTINPVAHTYNGSGNLRPLVVDGSAIYLQARGSVIRDLGYDLQTDKYKGNELTIFASHLFEGHTIIDWAYQQIPHSIIWVVRDDGVKLGLTYVKEHQVVGWHEHDTDGLIKKVCTIPEGLEDAQYNIVQRLINGRQVKYIERTNTRLVTDIKDAVFMDSSITYDGRNTGLANVSLAGSSTWTYETDLTLNASSSIFTIDDVGDHIIISDQTDTLRCEIKSWTNNKKVVVRPNRTVPIALRNQPTTSWAKAIREVGNLWHLEGKRISALGDGFVVANPNNSEYQSLTVTSGAITFAEPYSVIHVGLPYNSDMQTLNIDDDGKQSTIADLKKNISKVSLLVESSRGIWAGPDENNLDESKLRESEGYDDPIALKTDLISINIKPEWNSTGSIFIRQFDPLPLSILSVTAGGFIPLPKTNYERSK